VKPVTLLTMLEAVDWTPVTIDAAKAAPGSVGSWTPRPDGVREVALPVDTVAGRTRLAQGR
jgi:hypothetical protein